MDAHETASAASGSVHICTCDDAGFFVTRDAQESSFPNPDGIETGAGFGNCGLQMQCGCLISDQTKL